MLSISSLRKGEEMLIIGAGEEMRTIGKVAKLVSDGVWMLPARQ